MVAFSSLTPVDSPQVIFDAIDSYAATLPMHRTTQSMSRSLLDCRLQVGRLSGIALYRFGTKVLEGITHTTVQRKLRRIWKMLKKDPQEWSRDTMQELLELQR